MRTIAEADVQRLRGVRDNLSININDLNLQVNGLTDELALLKSTHAEVRHTQQCNAMTPSVGGAGVAHVLVPVVAGDGAAENPAQDEHGGRGGGHSATY